ncbi:MAG: terpene cyclase/mutase family protein [Verrucomicrobia bacterium]|nr:terpene cyclase/mutase family protein [Verrucomicrobiota bacterium]
MRSRWFEVVSILTLLAAGCAAQRPPVYQRSPDRTSAEARALVFLSREVPRWYPENQCFSCHNNGDAARALYVASELGYSVPTNALADTTAWLQTPDRWDQNKGDPAYSDKRLATVQFTAALATAIETRHVSNTSALLAAARRLKIEQHSDGAWHIEPTRALGSPATYGTPLATALAARALAGVPDKLAAADAQRAMRWLHRSSVDNVLGAAAVLMGLRGESDSQLGAKKQECLDFLRRSQTRDGGWGAFPDSPPEAFDTAIALLALAETPSEPGVDALIRRGRDYLEGTQLADGSWPETTRPPGGESYAQRISTTAWATLALLRTVPVRRGL